MLEEGLRVWAGKAEVMLEEGLRVWAGKAEVMLKEGLRVWAGKAEVMLEEGSEPGRERLRQLQAQMDKKEVSGMSSKEEERGQVTEDGEEGKGPWAQ
ncbi:unnamed protein product [Caretta caretta]